LKKQPDGEIGQTVGKKARTIDLAREH